MLWPVLCWLGCTTQVSAPPAANAPPSAVVLAPDGLQPGVVLVSYTLADAESDSSSITVEFEDARGVFAPATPAAGAGDGVTALATTPSGVAHVFAWDSAVDRVALSAEDEQVRIRIAATGPRSAPSPRARRSASTTAPATRSRRSR